MARGHEPYIAQDEQKYKKLLMSLADTFGELELRVNRMEAAIGEHVANSQGVFINGLEIQSLLKQNWVPAASVSMAFEEVEMEGENEEFLANILERAK